MPVATRVELLPVIAVSTVNVNSTLRSNGRPPVAGDGGISRFASIGASILIFSLSADPPAAPA